MTANELIFNAALIITTVTLVGIAWGFLILKIQGPNEGEES